MDWQAFWLTARLAALVAAVLVVVGLPVAYWITYSRWRWKFIAEADFALPIVLPHGAWFLCAGRAGTAQPTGTWLGSAHGSHAGLYLRRLGHRFILYSFPFAVQPFAASFAAVDLRLIAASQTLGVSRFKTFFRVILPLSVPGLVTGGFELAHTMGEFGGCYGWRQISGVTRTVSIDIYDKVQAINCSGANATALVCCCSRFRCFRSCTP